MLFVLHAKFYIILHSKTKLNEINRIKLLNQFNGISDSIGRFGGRVGLRPGLGRGRRNIDPSGDPETDQPS